MTAPTAAAPLLSVRNLKTYFAQDEGTVRAVDGVSFDLSPGVTLGVVGESGCGKSITARSILRIVDRPGRIVEGEIHFRRSASNGAGADVVDLAKLEPNSAEMRAIRGAEIALIFQEPMSSFSPVHSIGNQIIEAIRLHQPVGPRRGRRDGHRRGGDVPGARGRARAGRRDLPRAAASLHTGVAALDPTHSRAGARAADADRGRRAASLRSAERLSLPSPLRGVHG